jgi:hypothetical protein
MKAYNEMSVVGLAFTSALASQVVWFVPALALFGTFGQA